MSSLTAEKRNELLSDLARMGSQGRAEGESTDNLAKTFYPVKEHLRMLDPEVVMVVGPRGSGKTEIFRVVTDANLAEAISQETGTLHLKKIRSIKWLKGFPLGRDGFDANGLRRFIDASNDDIDAVQRLWFAYLVRVLRHDLVENSPLLGELLKAQGGASTEIYQAYVKANDTPLLQLDKIDEQLERDDRYVYIGYDELDTLGGSDWEAMTKGVQGLVAFWAAYTRRWRRIRPKVFLRTDLFERFSTSGGADLAKIAANRVEISWSERQLYSMLLKRIANTSDQLSEYIRETTSGVDWKDHITLGALPFMRKWTDARPVIERMIGPYMGANRNKGLSYRWPLAHVQDGCGRAIPRPLVRLFEEAASLQINSTFAVAGMRILHSSSLRRAIDRVSSEHVDHARDEWNWIDGVIDRLSGLTVPIARRDVEKRLGSEGPWSKTPREEIQPPFSDPRTLLDYLVEIGLLRARSDGRIEAPDLFLYGLGLKHKGGVRRR